MMKSSTTILVVGLAAALFLPRIALAEPMNILSASPMMILLGQNCSDHMRGAFPKTEEPWLANLRRQQQGTVEGSSLGEKKYYNTHNARRRRTQFGGTSYFVADDDNKKSRNNKRMEEDEDEDHSNKYRQGRCTEKMIIASESEALEGSTRTEFGVVTYYPIYDPDTYEEVGAFTGVAIEVPNGPDPNRPYCTVQGAFSFDRNPDTTYFDSQVNTAWTCSSGEQIPIVGGSGRYAGISGWAEQDMIPPMEGYALLRLIICDEMKTTTTMDDPAGVEEKSQSL